MQHLVFGVGRVGSNMAAYARVLGCAVETVSRAEAVAPDLARRIEAADVIALAVPDGAIAGLVSHWGSAFADKTVIHFSGALTVAGARSYHPLYSFPKTLLPAETLRATPIAAEPGAPRFDAIYPGAPNPTFDVPAEARAFYHALAVLTGNFAAHIWNEAAPVFQRAFPGAPPDALAFYLAGVVERFAETPAASMTGPLARRDGASVKANLDSLAGEPALRGLYEAFLRSAWPEWPQSPGSDQGSEPPRENDETVD